MMIMAVSGNWHPPSSDHDQRLGCHEQLEMHANSAPFWIQIATNRYLTLIRGAKHEPAPAGNASQTYLASWCL